MPYTKTALNRFKKEQVVSLYIEDQKQWIEKSKEYDISFKELQTKLAQSENHNKTLVETQHLKLDDETRKYKVKISQLEKELSEFKSTGNNPSVIKNLQNMISKLKTENEKIKAEHIHFNTIWKTEGITEQDIIDMKRQISNQCDLIKVLKEEHRELTKKQEYYHKVITKMFDSL